MTVSPFISAYSLRESICRHEISASDTVEAYLHRIESIAPNLNAFTEILHDRARERARQIDQGIKRGKTLGSLTGVPFAVKNLYDVRGRVTVAGSKINRGNTPAHQDAELIRRMENAGAILIGALNMGEYAYDFTGENAHYGNCANPWNINHMSGGSSSGSGAATAAGLAPISLGSDTNGSIRIPASFCGIFGLKPTYGRLPRTGTYPFSDSLDHLGPLARTVKDLAISFDAIQGYDPEDHCCVDKKPLQTESTITNAIDGLKIKKAGGYFSCQDFPAAYSAVKKVCDALNVNEEVIIPGALEGRSAAYLITNIEGSELHREKIKNCPEDFDPDTRDRFIAGALLPASYYIKAQQIRHWYRQRTLEVFKDTDIMIAPAAPCVAPKIGEKFIEIRGEKQMLRPNLGYFTQPISAIGLPSVVVPTWDENAHLPIGVQIIAAPWREDLCLTVAHYLETHGFATQTPPDLQPGND